MNKAEEILKEIRKNNMEIVKKLDEIIELRKENIEKCTTEGAFSAILDDNCSGITNILGAKTIMKKEIDIINDLL